MSHSGQSSTGTPAEVFEALERMSQHLAGMMRTLPLPAPAPAPVPEPTIRFDDGRVVRASPGFGAYVTFK